MKRNLVASLAALSALALYGCKEAEIVPVIAEPVDIEMTIDKTSLVMGETMVLTLATANRDESANEDFTVDLSAEKAGEDVAAQFFENFPSSVGFKKGESVVRVEINVKSEGIEGSTNMVVSASSRGYTISPSAGISVTVADYHYVTMSIENNADNTVSEGADFVLVADFGQPAEEDIVIAVTPDAGSEAYFDNLPESLTIAKGQSSVKSEPVTMVEDSGKKDMTLTLKFSSSSASIPVSNPVMEIKRVDNDKDLGEPLLDERYVYPSGAGVVFVSEANKSAVTSWNPGLKTQLVKPLETPHPGLSGWKFYNSLEFHNIAGLYTESKYGNHVPLGLGMQNTVLNQDGQAVDNDRYTTITSDGYARIWSVKETWKGTGPVSDTRPYGVGGFYCCKFDHGDPVQTPSLMHSQRHTRIFPGMRIEARIRLRGALNRFNPAFWLQGNEKQTWPYRGEVDILENPRSNAGYLGAWQTLHWGNSQNEDPRPTSGAVTLSTMSDWNIYWFEWSDDGKTIKCGINGKENLSVSAGKYTVAWPFDNKSINPQGLYILITMDAPNDWAGGEAEGWDSGFADITWEDSKTNENTPRMEIDWIRFYVSDSYSDPYPRYDGYLY